MNYLQWWYLIFEGPFILALFFIAMSMFGGLEMGSDHDIDVDHDIDHDMDADAHGGMGNHDSGFAVRALSVLGVGKVPVSIVIMSFCIIWGFTGFWANRLLEHVLILPVFFGFASIAIAFFASVIGTRFIARLIAQLMPKTETYGTSAGDLVGRRGRVLYAVNEKEGTVRLFDAHHTLLDVPCRTAEGSQALPAETQVVLTAYDAETRQYIVAVNPLLTIAAVH